MSRKKIVAGNWKMNKTSQEAASLVEEVIQLSKADTQVLKIFFPPFPFIHQVYGQIQSSGSAHFFVGAQNCHEKDSGAFTGEVSAQALASVGSSYVIVGHSERRQYFQENSELLIQKIKSALKNNMAPVFCFGELIDQRKSGNHFQVVRQQIEEVLLSFSTEELSQFILAYEPVWAIGTGETASPQQAQEMHAFVRKTLAENFGETIAQSMPILYGGSCNPSNAKELFACPDVDGGLIGGASLKSADFASIIKSF